MPEKPETPQKSANGWTEERRAAQREAIKNWSPWNKSTGPRTQTGKARAARNALKHGFRSREWLMLRAMLRQQRALHNSALTYARHQKRSNELLDSDRVERYNRLAHQGSQIITSMIMEKLCFSGVPDI